MMVWGFSFAGDRSPATWGLHAIAHWLFGSKSARILAKLSPVFRAVTDRRLGYFSHVAIATKKRLKALRGFAKFSGRARSCSPAEVRLFGAWNVPLLAA